MLAMSLFAMASAWSLAADNDVEDLLKTLRDNYKSAKAVKLTVQTKVNLHEEFTLSTEMSYQAPKKVFVQVSGYPDGAKLSLLGNDAKMQLTAPNGKHELPFSSDPLVRNQMGNLETICFWDWERQLSTAKGMNMETSKLALLKEKIDDKEWIVLEETTPDNVEVRYYIDPKKYFIMRSVVSQGGKVITDSTVKSFELDPKLDDSLFKMK